MVTLWTQAAAAASANSGDLASTLIYHPERVKAAIFLLNVTSAAAAVGDTLDVYVQSSMDGGATWDDFIHFTQVLGNGGAKKFLAYLAGRIAPSTALKAPQDAALAAGVQQGPLGPHWRVKSVIAGATPVFSFTVGCYPMLDERSV